jgi:hypothetical protein
MNINEHTANQENEPSTEAAEEADVAEMPQADAHISGQHIAGASMLPNSANIGHNMIERES